MAPKNKTIAGKEWLSHKGFERQLVAAYEKTTWLNRIGRGASGRSKH